MSHKSFGGGSIIAFDDGKISVDFSGTRKLFQFPSAFHSFLSTDDLELQGHVAILLQEEAEARLLEEARKREEKEQHQSGAKEKHSVVQPSPHMTQGTTEGVSAADGDAPSSNWIIPCNPNFFDISGAFSTLRSLDWRQWAKSIEVGDFVYIYVSKPVQAIMYKTVVRQTYIPYDQVDSSDAPFNLADDLEHTENPDWYMRLELIREFPPEALTLRKLVEHGLRGNVQGQRHTTESIQRLIDSVDV